MKTLISIIMFIQIFTIDLFSSAKESFQFEEKLEIGITLNNSESFVKLIEGYRELRLNNYKGNYYLVLNYTENIFLKSYQYEGDIDFSISLFEIGYINDKNRYELMSANYQTSENQKYFTTSKGLKLGLHKTEVENIFGLNYTIKNNIMIYETDNIEDEILLKYNMTKYLIEIIFKDNKVVSFKFGFEYP